MRIVRHGTMNEYSNHGCRCRPCRTAASAYNRPRIDRWRAQNLSKGLTAMGHPRKRCYDDRALDSLTKYGFEPDPAWVDPDLLEILETVEPDPLLEAIEGVDPKTAEYLRRLVG